MGVMPTYHIHVNGTVVPVDAAPDMPLLWVLRDLVGLTGSKFGCGIGACSACAVLVDGNEAQSCQLAVGQVGNKKITTVEGISTDGTHPVQRAWIEHDVPQCGYCQAGQVIAAVALLKHKPNPTDADIDAAFAGHVCRCGTYPRIREAVKAAAGAKK